MIQDSFEIIIDGVTKWRQENNNPRTLSNVKVWASRGHHGFPQSMSLTGTHCSILTTLGWPATLSHTFKFHHAAALYTYMHACMYV